MTDMQGCQDGQDGEAQDASTQNICVDGDVVFVVGGDIGEPQRFRVSSAIMKNASKVFSIMLSPGFSEGNTLLKMKEVSIPLPEDDADGMFAILCVLHGRNELVPQKISPKYVYDISVLAEKYDLLNPLMFAAKFWLDLTAVTDIENWWLLMSAACLFQDSKAFSETTRQLVMLHEGSYVIFARRDELDYEVSARICLLLEETRAKVQVQLLEALYQPTFSRWLCSCGWNARCLQWITERYGDYWLRPFEVQKRSISDVFTSMRNLSVSEAVAEPLLLPSWNTSGCDKVHDKSAPGKLRKSLVDDADRSLLFEGICLNCARTGDAHEAHSPVE